VTAIDLTGRRALVVGTAHDAVRACALSLAAAGATVVAAIDGTADDLERELKEAAALVVISQGGELAAYLALFTRHRKTPSRSSECRPPRTG